MCQGRSAAPTAVRARRPLRRPRSSSPLPLAAPGLTAAGGDGAPAGRRRVGRREERRRPGGARAGKISANKRRVTRLTGAPGPRRLALRATSVSPVARNRPGRRDRQPVDRLDPPRGSGRKGSGGAPAVAPPLGPIDAGTGANKERQTTRSW